MEKLLDGIGEVFKWLFTQSPVASVLFLVCVGMGFAMRHLYIKNSELQALALTKAELYEKSVRDAEKCVRTEYEVKLKAKDDEINKLHDREAERDQSYAKILEGLRVAIVKGNVGPFLRSVWNGVAALGKHHGLDIQNSGMLDHMTANQTDPTNQFSA